MKKLSIILTLALVVGLAAPAMAADNVEITGDVTTIFEVGSYGDNPGVTADALADGDALDEDYTTDADAFPAKKAFYQEIGFNITGNVNQDVTFDLAIDTLTNQFTSVEGEELPNGDVLGDPTGDGDDSALKMDTALLTVNTLTSTIKLGDMTDYNMEPYFMDEEDLEGVEVATALAGYDVTGFVLSENEDFEGEDFYGVTAARNLGAADVTGKLYQVRKDGNAITNFAIAADAAVNNALTVNGEVVSNDADKEYGDYNAANEGDTLINLGAEYAVDEALTVNGTVEMVGEDFVAVEDDLEAAADYDLFEVGAEYALNAANTVTGTFTLVTPGDDDAEDKDTIEVALDNTTGAFTNTASVEMTSNDEFNEDQDVTLITLGTEYDMTEATVVTAELVNKSMEYADGSEEGYNYLTAGVDHQVSENVNWNTEAQMIDGSDDWDDAEGNSLTTELSVSF